MNKFKFELGQEVVDTITGFTGVIRVRSQYLTGCNAYGIQNTKLKDGKPAKWEYIDESLLKKTKVKPILKDRDRAKGGPTCENHNPPQ